LWDVPDGKSFVLYAAHEKSGVRSVAYSPNGKSLASGGGDMMIRLWDVVTRKGTSVLGPHRYSVMAVAFSPDGKTLASGSADLGPKGLAFQMSTDPDDWQLVARKHPGNQKGLKLDRSIRLWDAETGKNIGALEGHKGSVFTVAFSPDGKTIASGSMDKTIRLWDVAARKNTAVLEEHAGAVNTVAFSPDGKTLASGSNDKTIKIWQLQTGK